MSANAILFPLGVRFSTWLTAVVFVFLAIANRDRRFLLAGIAWLTGFEAAFQVASLTLGRLPLGLPGPIFFIIFGLTVVAFVTRSGVRPDLSLLFLAFAFFAAWVATGFHLNGHQHGMFSLHTRIAGFDPTAELLNDVSKTLWAAAYLVPLLRRQTPAWSWRRRATTWRGLIGSVYSSSK
jgi:hypothetical protein